jgi:hypothetical protein
MSRALGPPANKIMVFGAPATARALGCLLFGYDVESVFNAYGKSSSAYSTQSILNHYSNLGHRSRDECLQPLRVGSAGHRGRQGNYYGAHRQSLSKRRTADQPTRVMARYGLPTMARARWGKQPPKP